MHSEHPDPDEADLRAHLAQTDELLQLAPAAIVVRDPATSAVRFWNRGAEELYGWSPAEALGKVTHDLLQTVFPVPLEVIDAALESVGHWEGDLVHTRRDGITLPVASRQVLQRDASGRASATLEINIDTTERRNARLEREERIRQTAALEELERGQVALRASEQRYRQLVETANEGIWLIDTNGKTTFANPQMAMLLGTTPEAMLGRPVLDFCFDEDRDLVRERIGANIAGRAEQFDFRFRRPDGSPVYVLGGTDPVTDAAGTVAGALGMFSDISDRRRAEEDRAVALERERRLRAEAEAAVHSRDEFLALVSHDLRTPLTAIKIRTQLVRRRLERGGETAPLFVDDALDTIEATVDRLFLQVNELVDTARIQAGLALILDADDVDLVGLVQAAVADSSHDPLVHHMRVERALPTLVGRWDAVRLRRVLSNLLTNAVKYSPSGGDVVVRVRQDGAKAVVEVADQGVGIPTNEIPRIFERYFRASNVAGRIAGEGIGLAAALHIAEQHGGTLEAQAEDGRGSTFTLRLPLHS